MNHTGIVALITHPKSNYLSSDYKHDIFTAFSNNLQSYGFTNYVRNRNELTIELLGDTKPKKLFQYLLHSSLNLNKFYIKKILLTRNFKDIHRSIKFILEINKNIIIRILYLFKKDKSIIQNELLRQENITLSHLDVFRHALTCEAKILMVLEDDIYFNNSDQEIKYINEVINIFLNDKNNMVMSISESFKLHELAIDSLVIESVSKINHNEYPIYYLKYPITNTACAIMYKIEIIPQLIKEIEKMNRFKFIPIDHKINIAFWELMQKQPEKNFQVSILSPGIFLQRSLFNGFNIKE